MKDLENFVRTVLEDAPLGQVNMPDLQGRSHDQLRAHLTDFLAAYNFARKLKSLNGPRPLRTHLQNLDSGAASLHP